MTIQQTQFGVSTSEDCINGIEMLQAAGADYSVEKKQVAYSREIPGSMGGVDSSGNIVPEIEHVAIDSYVPVRTDTNMNISDRTVGDNYVVLQNREVISVIDAICGQHDLKYRYMTQIKGGRGLAVQVECPALNKSLSVGDDQNGGFLTISNFHDGTGALKVHVSMIRMRCANQLAAIGREFKNKRGSTNLAAHSIRHSANMEQRVRDMINTYRSGMTELTETADLLRDLSGVICSDATKTEYFKALLNPDATPVVDMSKRSRTIYRNKLRELERAARNPINVVSSASGTWYEAIQAATWYGTHGITAKGASTSKEEARYVSKTFGAGAKFNVEALELATTMAGI